MFKYVSLGDSIAFGMSSDPQKGFSDLYSTYLESQADTSYSFINTAVPGWKTLDLYNSITRLGGLSDEAVMDADVITISIGANNLLGPVIGSIPDVIKFMPDKYGLRKKLINTLLPTHLSRSLLNRMMNRGLYDFNQEWPMILSKIREKAPEANISVLTLYNALRTEHPFYPFFNPYVVKVNNSIRAQSDRFQYDIVDVYSFFQNSTASPIDFDFEQDALDPHPNNLGHQLIFHHLKKHPNPN